MFKLPCIFNNMNEIINLKSVPENQGERIDVFISNQCEITRSAAQKLLSDGNVTVDGKSVKKNFRLGLSNSLEIILPEPELLDVVAQDIPLEIVYEDSSLLVVNKPKGMVVHPAPGNPDKTLVNALMYHCKGTLSSINGVIRPGIVHRIDKDTSGLLIVAKNDVAHIALAEQIKSHSFTRVYNAILTGNLKETEGVIDAPIARHPVDRKRMAIQYTDQAKHAVTHYKVIESLNRYDYAELKLETGRTHQIRVHMSSIGHPVIGDPVYKTALDKFEKANAEILRGQCLHAREIGFVHPITNEYMHFDSGLPDYFQAILEKLRKM